MNKIREAMDNLPGHWHKGFYDDTPDGGDGSKMCGVGHLAKVMNMGYIDQPFAQSVECRLLDQVAGEMYPDRMGTLPVGYFPFFNDHPDTTEVEVLTVMEKAAIKFDEQV